MPGQRWVWKTMAAVMVAGLVTGCGRQEPAGAPPAAEVAVVSVEPQRVVMTTELPGRTSGYLVAEIRPQVSGLVLKRLFEEGSDVKAGQVLYEIDPAPFQAAYEQALATVESSKKAADRARAALAAGEAGVVRQEATLALAKINQQRMEDLYREKAVSASERDRAATDLQVAEAGLLAVKAEVESDRAAIAASEAAIKQAQAALASAQVNLGYTKITAPIAGRIGRSNVTEGAIVTAYTAVLATIQSLDPIYVDVPQSTTELMRLQKALASGRLNRNGNDQNRVRLILEDNTPYPLDATLQFRDVTVDPTTGSVVLRIVAPNPEGALLPGMFVRAVVEEGVNEQAILAPQQAVSRDPKGNPLALVVDGQGKVQQRSLVIDRAMGDKWLVTSGLAAGDQLIVEGKQRIRPGDAVKAVAFEERRKATAGGKDGAAQAVSTSN